MSEFNSHSNLPIYHYPHLIESSMPIPPLALYEEQLIMEKMNNTLNNRANQNRTKVNHLVSLTQFCNNYCKEFNVILSKKSFLLDASYLPNIQQNGLNLLNKKETTIQTKNDEHNDQKQTQLNGLVKTKKLKNKKKKKKKSIRVSLNNDGSIKNFNENDTNSIEHYTKLDEKLATAGSSIVNKMVDNYKQKRKQTLEEFENHNNKILPNILSKRSVPYDLNGKNKNELCNSSKEIKPQNGKNSNNIQLPTNNSNNGFICNWLVNNINNNNKCKSRFNNNNNEYNDQIKFHTTNELVSGLNFYYQAKSILNQQNSSSKYSSLQHYQKAANTNQIAPNNVFFPPIF